MVMEKQFNEVIEKLRVRLANAYAIGDHLRHEIDVVEEKIRAVREPDGYGHLFKTYEDVLYLYHQNKCDIVQLRAKLANMASPDAELIYGADTVSDARFVLKQDAKQRAKAETLRRKAVRKEKAELAALGRISRDN